MPKDLCSSFVVSHLASTQRNQLRSGRAQTIAVLPPEEETLSVHGAAAAANVRSFCRGPAGPGRSRPSRGLKRREDVLFLQPAFDTIDADTPKLTTPPRVAGKTSPVTP